MTIAIATSADATGNGWSFIGPVGPASDWYAEKPVQCGGKLLACATSTANLVTAIAQVEINQNGLGVASCENVSFDGNNF